MNSHKLIKTKIALGIFAIGSVSLAAAAPDALGLEFWLWIFALPNWVQAAFVVALGVMLAWLGLGLYRLLNHIKSGKISLRTSLYTSLAGALVGILVIIFGAGPWQDLIFKKIVGLPPTAVGPPEIMSVYELTESLLGLGTAYQQAPETARNKALNDLLATAYKRYDLMTELIESNPGAVLDAALPDEIRAGFPAQVQALLEEWVDLEGELEVFVEDYPEGRSRLLHYLQGNGQRITLHFRGEESPGLISGTPVSTHGVLLESAMALDATDLLQTSAIKGVARGEITGGTPAPTPSVLGAQKTLLILVNFQDSPIQPYTLDEARSQFFGTTSEFFLENSQQQTWLSGDVTGWFTLPLSASVCDTTSIATQAKTAAATAGFNTGAYSHLVYAFPQIACAWSGLSTIGGNPSQTWITGELVLGITAHELGHAIGLFHSHAMDCGNTTLGSSCTMYEYNDLFDMMGSSSFAHFNAFQKERLGWLNAGVSPPITQVETDGTYVIDAYETGGTGSKALKILKSKDLSTGQSTWYYIESRQAIGFDAEFLPTSYPNVYNGLLIHTGTEVNGNSSYLLDMTSGSGDNIFYEWRDPALVVGQSFVDPAAGVTIITEAMSSTQAEVTVTFGAVPGSPSSIAITTDQPSYTRGQTVYVRATVTAGGFPIANKAVSFTITKANGSKVSGSATTGTNGMAVYKLQLKKQDPLGTYQASAMTKDDGASAPATITFVVR